MGMVTGSGNTAIHQLFSYDSSGNVVSVDYSSNGGSTFTTYYYLGNAQNDIVKIIDGNGATVVEYKYDSWGKPIGVTGTLANTLGVNQPFRYRGYVYDTETGWYYLQSRYYDPSIGRFVSADVYLSTGQGVLGHNAFAYCANNPIIKKDSTGYAVETVFDIITLSISIVEVASNPTDVWVWIGLVGDVVDLIPFVTGVGELVRTIRIVDAVDDVVDAARAADNLSEAGEVIVKYGDEVKLPYQIKASDAVDAWDDFLGPTQTSYNRSTGNNEIDRIFSADGSRSIRFGGHEMKSIGTTKAHFHYENWLFDPTTNTVYVKNFLHRLK